MQNIKTGCNNLQSQDFQNKVIKEKKKKKEREKERKGKREERRERITKYINLL